MSVRPKKASAKAKKPAADVCERCESHSDELLVCCERCGRSICPECRGADDVCAGYCDA